MTTITGNLENELGAVNTAAIVSLRPANAAHAIIDGPDVKLGGFVYEGADVPDPITVDAGVWVIVVSTTEKRPTTGRGNPDPLFPARSFTVDLTVDRTWAEIFAGDAAFQPVTPSQVQEATAARDAAVAAMEAAQAVGNTNDTIMTAVAADPESAFSAGLLATIAATAAPGLPGEMADVTIGALPTGSAKAVGTIDGVIYGFGEGFIRKTLDGGATWSVVTALPSGGSNLVGLRLNTAGEAIACCTEGVWLSSGWGTGSVTWGTKKITPNGIAAPQPFSFDGEGNKFIYAEYGPNGTQGFIDSRYAYITTDGGVTWTQVWDSDVDAPLSAPDITHLHGVAYDPWNDTFYLSEGHGADAGIYHSTDDGATWAVAPGMYVANIDGVTASPTVLCATDEGLVCGGDSYNIQGLHGVVRTTNPMDQELTLTWAWRTGHSGNNGWGHQAHRDPLTGIVYVMYRSQSTGVAPIIAAGTPTSGTKVWEWPDAASFTITDTFLSWAVDPQRRAVIYGYKGAVGYQITGTIPRPRAQSTVDTGAIFGGDSRDATSVAVGLDASTGTGLRSVAIGIGAKAEFADTAAVGYDAQASAGEGVAFGKSTRSAGDGVAIGYIADAAGTAVAIGAGADADAQSVSVGRNAKAASPNNVSLGYTAQSLIGSNSVALGAASTTSGSNQVAVGARYFEIGELASGPTNPAANKARLAVKDNGSGKTQLVVIFPTGAEIVLATEA